MMLRQHFPIMIVGAGPGDPDLLTVKAMRLIAEVDVIVYDGLVSEPVFDLVPAGTMKIFAGKSARNHFMPQDKINTLLVDLYHSGRRVMRLKGGDPFLFGRGGEEVVHLAKRGIPFEIVPGITSSAGAAAYAGIPLTHRGLARGVRFVTGHTTVVDGLDLNWQSLADPDTTLVIYMGLTNIRKIASELITAGLPAKTPAAAINMGTRPEQRTITATLDTLAYAIERAKLKGATLLIVGQVVNLSKMLAWFTPSQEAEAKVIEK